MKRLFKEKTAPVNNIDALPVTFNRHRVYILPTAYGFLFILILFAMLLGSINYNNNLGFLLVFLLGSITLVSMIHTYRNLVGIRILSVSVNPVFAGKTAVYKFLVRSESIQRRGVAFMIEKKMPAIENLSPGTDETIAVKSPTRTRGIAGPGRMIVWSRYPLGLFRAWTVIRPDVTCVVYPKPVAGPFRMIGGQGREESGGQADRRGVDDFSGLKQYQPGDPVGMISWKTFSRGLGIFTKEFSGDGGISVMLDYEAVKADDMELKLSRLTDMVIRAHNMNAEYGLLLPGKTIAPGKGERHKHKCLMTLAVYGLEGKVEGGRYKD